MKRFLLNILLCSALFVGCKDQVLGYDSFEEFIQVNNIQPSQIIYYTTNNGSVVDIDDYIGNAKVISNGYENGRGAIVCDRIITSIGNQAFYWCSGLTSITIPNSVTSIGIRAFADCQRLTSITIGNSVTSIGNYAFAYCDGLTSITIPNSVTAIGVQAFAYCEALNEFKGKFASSDGRCLIVDGVLNSFAPSGLTTYTIPNSVTSIGDYAFYECSGLTSITIPNSVTSIGNFAFSHCDGITSITIGNSVTSIGYCAFYDCSGLTSVYCKATTPPTLGASTLLGSSVFDHNASGRKIYVPTASVSAYKSATYWSEYASSIVGYDF